MCQGLGPKKHDEISEIDHQGDRSVVPVWSRERRPKDKVGQPERRRAEPDRRDWIYSERQILY